MSKTSRSQSFSISPTILNMSDLAVNRQPDIDLAIDLSSLTAKAQMEAIKEQKERFLEKMGQAKEKLDQQMGSQEQHLKDKLVDKKKKQFKLLQKLVTEDYKRKAAIQEHNQKVQKAQEYIQKDRKQTERKAVKEFRQQLLEKEKKEEETIQTQREISRMSYLKLNQTHS